MPYDSVTSRGLARFFAPDCSSRPPDNPRPDYLPPRVAYTPTRTVREAAKRIPAGRPTFCRGQKKDGALARLCLLLCLGAGDTNHHQARTSSPPSLTPAPLSIHPKRSQNWFLCRTSRSVCRWPNRIEEGSSRAVRVVRVGGYLLAWWWKTRQQHYVLEPSWRTTILIFLIVTDQQRGAPATTTTRGVNNRRRRWTILLLRRGGSPDRLGAAHLLRQFLPRSFCRRHPRLGARRGAPPPPPPPLRKLLRQGMGGRHPSQPARMHETPVDAGRRRRRPRGGSPSQHRQRRSRRTQRRRSGRRRRRGRRCRCRSRTADRRRLRRRRRGSHGGRTAFARPPWPSRRRPCLGRRPPSPQLQRRRRSSSSSTIG